MRIVTVEEVLRIIRRVTGKPVCHVDMMLHDDCEEYINRRR